MTKSGNGAAVREELDALRDDVAALRNDLKGFARATGQATKSGASDAGTRIAEAARGLEERCSQRMHEAYDTARVKSHEAAENAREEVRGHPLSYVVGALAAGVLIGGLTFRK